MLRGGIPRFIGELQGMLESMILSLWILSLRIVRGDTSETKTTPSGKPQVHRAQRGGIPKFVGDLQGKLESEILRLQIFSLRN